MLELTPRLLAERSGRRAIFRCILSKRERTANDQAAVEEIIHPAPRFVQSMFIHSWSKSKVTLIMIPAEADVLFMLRSREPVILSPAHYDGEAALSRNVDDA